MSDPEHPTTKAMLRWLLGDGGLNETQLARTLRVAVSTVSRWRSEQRRPGPKSLERLRSYYVNALRQRSVGPDSSCEWKYICSKADQYDTAATDAHSALQALQQRVGTRICQASPATAEDDEVFHLHVVWASLKGTARMHIFRAEQFGAPRFLILAEKTMKASEFRTTLATELFGHLFQQIRFDDDPPSRTHAFEDEMRKVLGSQ